MILFGSANLVASQINANGTLQSGIVFGICQDVMVDLKVDLKELWGQKRFPEAVVDGKGSIDITVKFARIYAAQLGMAFGGTTSQGGGYAQAVDESHVISGGSSGALTNTLSTVLSYPVVTATISGTATTYVFTSGAPVAGVSYGISGNTLTFAAGDNGITVLVTYFYVTSADNTSFTTTVPNPLVGSAPVFALQISKATNNPNNNTNSQMILSFNRVMAPGLKLDFKVDDYVVPDVNMKAFSDGNGNVTSIYSKN
jgi:hypothetical protein